MNSWQQKRVWLKIVPNNTRKTGTISTHKYKNGGIVSKSVLDLTIYMGNQKKVMTTTEVKDVVGKFVSKLHNLKNVIYIYKELPLDENDNNIDVKLNDINYKRIVMKLHDASWIFFQFF